MNESAWLSLAACTGQLALAGLALARVGKSPLALPLSLLSIALSTWNFAHFAYAVSGEEGWRLVALTATIITAPCAAHFILAFTGQRRRFAPLIYSTYGLFGLFAVVALSALGSPWVAVRATSLTFSRLTMALVTLLLGGGWALLVLHLRRAPSLEERIRTGLLLLGLVLLVALPGTDLMADLGFNVPRLGTLGTLLGLPVMATVALRFQLFGKALSSEAALYAVTLAVVGVLAYLIVFRLFAAEQGALVVGTAAITFALLAAARRVVSALVTQRERLERLATLGRFSAQMAHDLKNPIAALKGAAQFLKEEHAQGRPWDDKGDFLDLLLEQVERLDRVVSTYQRLGRVEPLPRPLDLNQLVEDVLSLQAFTGYASVKREHSLEKDLPKCSGDYDLLANALENLVRNACEAMPQGGTLMVRTQRESTDRAGVVVSVEDTGEGMDARTRERAFDEFFTTKASGSGLGLAFVRRVVEAHGGEVSLTSREGRGTIVSLRLPCTAAPEGVAAPGEGAPWPSR
ncbi:two-component system sensor histidine kinase NtrB [Hyalangium minutum]|uniref:histidine kinase n=1 Tax=Hyalangium minutum TaxID=394096 RepID=A0A085VXG6_9BACT|nr:ATP-binding protein [Hyalangium minutum]KFE60129.1 Flagellar sensor histidine kinase FleS [Hyalangium minutum]